MKFTYEGVEYRIEFQYDTKRTGKKVRNYTTARIKTGTQDTEKVIAEGRVVRYEYDRFDKEYARQAALEAAIANNLFFQDIDALRDFGRAANTAYHRRPGGLDYERAVRKGLVTAPPAVPVPSFLIQTA